MVLYDHPPLASVGALAESLLDALPGRFSLCGLSLGAMVGMQIAIVIAIFAGGLVWVLIVGAMLVGLVNMQVAGRKT